MIDTIGLWWLSAMSVLNIFISIHMIGKPRKPMTAQVASGLIVWSLAYLVLYLHILGVFK